MNRTIKQAIVSLLIVIPALASASSEVDEDWQRVENVSSDSIWWSRISEDIAIELKENSTYIREQAVAVISDPSTFNQILLSTLAKHNVVHLRDSVDPRASKLSYTIGGRDERMEVKFRYGKWEYRKGYQTSYKSITPSGRWQKKLTAGESFLQSSVTTAGLAPLKAVEPAQQLADATRNIVTSGSSNDGLFAQYRDIYINQIQFSNDSTKLYTRQWNSLLPGLKGIQPDDIVSVVGCSIGPSTSVGSNETLSIGRTGIIEQALVLHGISEMQIYGEHCWSNEPQQNWPARSAIVTIKRKI